MFVKYQHVERWGTDEVENIADFGDLHIQPKLDGSNGTVWYEEADGSVHCGSRSREVTPDKDNQGFATHILGSESIRRFYENEENRRYRLCGEWLVKHKVKYVEDAYRRFWVFDVIDISKDGDVEYVPFDDYASMLSEYGIDYAPKIMSCKGVEDAPAGSLERSIEWAVANCGFLTADDIGEGVVIKNYGYRNKYGRRTWAKIVRQEFSEKKRKPKPEQERGVEYAIAEEYITKAFCEKELEKIKDACGGWNSKLIPRLLQTIWHEFVTEECWNFVKKYKQPPIDFNKLKRLVDDKVKSHLAGEIF